MIIKTPIQELIFVLDFFNKVYKEDQDTINSEFTKFFIKFQKALLSGEQYLIIHSFDAGTDIPFFSRFDGRQYFLQNFTDHE
jgi:hypothetical protein